ncbi:enoyl-CoA hydratase [Oleomonas cavernae]|uniref:Enoyl-CoA hydratase n=1 Tax=Oleomonas cavernae TaxID=2320859 RepID=A0A418VUN4_9PROT|nr:enoyl-CoA hydratase-related protein [Oleomonas cavernae]RJF80834.1 enoyl-CoA hydratase [Oleomonas cavernae]
MSEDIPSVTLAVDNGLATITLARPDKGNALGYDNARALRDVALACDENPEVRAVLLKADGKNFCVGGDLGTFVKSDNLPLAVKELTIEFHAALSKLARMRAPLVVAVQGAAAGAGVALAALGDIVIAARASHYTIAYTGIGFSPDGGTTYTLPRLIGLRRFQELALTNRRIDAAEAASIGLVTRVVDDEQLPAEAEATARRLAEGPTQAFGAIRQLLLGTFNAGFEGHLEQEARYLSDACRSADVKEGIAAVLARRKPAFQGR